MTEILIPFAQILLAVALLLVAIMCMRLDAKLNALRKGKDGVAAAAIELSTAVSRADVAIKALRAHSEEATSALQERINEAQSIADGLKFLTTTARALEPRAQPTRLQPQEPTKPEARDDHWAQDDFRPARRDAQAGARWESLR
jgi:hypothetical protein